MGLWCGAALVIGISVVIARAAEVGDALPWWKTTTIYQLCPRSFKDSDGDGIGDLRGIIQMADYLKELGVGTIWLTPIYSSPMADFGYDISNFTSIEPIFGTMQDFHDLVAKFKQLGIKLMMDFVSNQSSDEHPWFQKSIQKDPDYSDFYIWKDPKYDENNKTIPPNNWLSVFGGSAWEWNDQRQQYYFHQFAVKQPDLNFWNPAVVGNMTEVMNFWLDKGVDGIRIDAAKHIYENNSFPDEPPVPGTEGKTWDDLQHIYTQNQPETYTLMWKWADEIAKRIQGDGIERIMVLEIYDTTKRVISYYGTGNHSFEFPFDFTLLTRWTQSSRAPDVKAVIEEWISLAPEGGQLTWVVGNHDNPRIAERYGSEMVDAINLITGVLPGIMVTYYGDEIGMRNTYIRYDQNQDPRGFILGPDHYLEGTRDPGRSPMQWNDSDSAGFSSTQDTWLPVNPNYWKLNVEAQRRSSNSHLKVYQKLQLARNDSVLQYGDLKVLAPDNDTLVVVRGYQNSYFALLINMGSKTRTYTSQNFFANNGLDLSMHVVVSSTNCGYSTGLYQKQGSLNLTLRPKAAVLLTTKNWSTNSSSRLSGAPYMQLTCVISLLAFFILKSRLM